MTKPSRLLLLDAFTNFVLGVLLLAFSDTLATFLGIPPATQRFYPSLLGAVFIGITIALLVQASCRDRSVVGLGPAGAAAINLSGGVVLAAWLLLGHLELPTRGQILLWSLAVLLAGLSCCELLLGRRR